MVRTLMMAIEAIKKKSEAEIVPGVFLCTQLNIYMEMLYTPWKTQVLIICMHVRWKSSAKQ